MNTHSRKTIPMILDILHNTPTWVYILFAVLVLLGSSRLRSGERDARRLCFMPVVFIVLGLAGFNQRSDSIAISAWLVAAAIGLTLGSLVRPKLQAAAGRFRVTLPGSAWPLLRILAIFCVHYFLAVASVLSFDHRVDFTRMDAGVSGMAAGFFAGWLWRFVQAYRVAKARSSIGTATNAVA